MQLNTSGIGLGLNICKRITETFHGDIRVESVPNQGSKFTFSIRTGGAGDSPDEADKGIGSD